MLRHTPAYCILIHVATSQHTHCCRLWLVNILPTAAILCLKILSDNEDSLKVIREQCPPESSEARDAVSISLPEPSELLCTEVRRRWTRGVVCAGVAAPGAVPCELALSCRVRGPGTLRKLRVLLRRCFFRRMGGGCRISNSQRQKIGFATGKSHGERFCLTYIVGMKLNTVYALCKLLLPLSNNQLLCPRLSQGQQQNADTMPGSSTFELYHKNHTYEQEPCTLQASMVQR